MKPINLVAIAGSMMLGVSGAVLAGCPAVAQHAGHTKAPQKNDAPSTVDYKRAHDTMMKGMGISYSGNSDVDFVRGMIPHHQGAIDMAKVQLKHGKNPEMRALAEKIIADQAREIADMQAWLKTNAKP